MPSARLEIYPHSAMDWSDGSDDSSPNLVELPQLGYFVPFKHARCKCGRNHSVYEGVRRRKRPAIESPRSRRSVSQCSCGSASRRSSVASPMPPLNNTVEMYVEPVIEETGERGGGWETHRVRLTRVPGYGFGIAVSGGRDNPHFASGDPAIAVSDVLRAGPAEDKLQVNDRIVSVNGIPLENVEYARAVQVLRDSGSAVSLVVRRRAPAAAPHTARVGLTRASKKEDFGIVLGCRLYIKELTPKAREQLSAAGQSLCEGDVITRINNTSCADTMSLKEAKKIIDSCKDRLNLVITREAVREATVNNINGAQNVYQNNLNSLGSEGIASPYSGQNLYVAAPSRSTLAGEASGRARAPLSAADLSQLDAPAVHHPPRPPPPRPEDYYSSRRQLQEEQEMNNQRNRPAGEPRLISFQKDGSVGLRLTGGNRSGVFVSAVQPGSPAALQGLAPGDKILKVNEMEMKSVTREEAVLFLLSLQERIDLIVQHSPDEYNAVASGQTVGDSFHIKCHFHYTEPIDGEMSFRCGDVFHVVDTLHNGTVGAWQVYRIGRNNQEVQKGVIPNKARAEELATAQFNATKKEMSTGGNESRGNFFRRRRSTHRRSKSLGKEHWDDVVFSDSISKFPAYERVVLKQPGFVRPVILFGAVSDLARDKLLRDYPDKFSSPQMDNTLEDGKSKSSSSGIIRLSGIRSIMERGKHALLDITPNAVDRLNYAQFYPIVIFLKADNKHMIKQLRHGLPKSAHKSSKKLLEQCQQIDRIWGHVFTQTVSLNETTLNTWYTKLNDIIQRSQQQQLWVSETKRSEPISDDFLFPMCTATESRLSYASSPESDLDVSPPPRLVKSSSDPSVATTQDNIDRELDINNMNINDAVPPPYTTVPANNSQGPPPNAGLPGDNGQYARSPMAHSPPLSPQGLYVTVPELPPRVERGPAGKPPGGVLLPAPPPGRGAAQSLRHNPSAPRPSAQERLFGPAKPNEGAEDVSSGAYHGGRPTSMVLGQPSPVQPSHQPPQGSLDRHRHNSNAKSYEGMYDSYGAGTLGAPPTSSGSSSLLSSSALALSATRLGPNAPDDLKVGPASKYEPAPPTQVPHTASPQRNSHELQHMPPDPQQVYSADTHRPHDAPPYHATESGAPLYHGAEQGYRPAPGGGRAPPPVTNGAPGLPPHARGPSLPAVPTSDYSKYSRTNSATVADYGGNRPSYKPVPPPKPKHYRPSGQDHAYNATNGNMEVPNGGTGGSRSNGYGYYAPPAHTHSHSQPAPTHSHLQHHQHHYSQQNVYGSMPQQSPPYSGPPAHHRSINMPNNQHVIDLAGSREQRGSAFELYRKPQHMHNISLSDATNASLDNDANITPKTKKKLSKKPSFIRIAVMDLFRSKSKNTHKVSRQKSLCESDLRCAQSVPPQKPALRREKSDLCGANYNLSRDQMRGQPLFRSNSSCERQSGLKPILKRQSSFCDGRSGTTCTVRDYDAKPIVKNLRRQNSMCEIESEKVLPMLRRQNSLIEYGRRGPYNQNASFNVITKIDPIYQRQHDMKHEPFHPTQPLPPEPVYQSKDQVIYDPIPKPRRTYASGSLGAGLENPYATKGESCKRVCESPYGTSSHNSSESPYATANECRQTAYALMRDSNEPSMSHDYSCKYSESPYGSKEQFLKPRLASESPYATKEEMLRQRFSESPYATKNEALRQQQMRTESPYSNKELCQHGSDSSSISESPYATRVEAMQQLNSVTMTYTGSELVRSGLELPYATRQEVRQSCGNTSRQESVSKLISIESPYVSKQEILNQKAAHIAGRDSIYSSKQQMEEKLEIIKQRNQAKKDLIYQSRKEVSESDIVRVREPIYVSKRELKESVIYESHQENKETSSFFTNKHQPSSRNSPYELCNANHLSWVPEPTHQTKLEALGATKIVSFQEIDFAALRLTDSKTDSEKQNSINMETSILKGEPIYETRLHGKTGHISNVLKSTSAANPYESSTSMETHYASECSMNFDVKPQSTPYTSQDLKANDDLENLPIFKSNRTVTFCEKIVEKSADSSGNTTGNTTYDETTIMKNETTVVQQDYSTEPTESGPSEIQSALPDGPHTTWGVFDSEGGMLEDRQWGVSLIIPPKAIAPGIKQKIYFTVSDPRHSQRVGGPPIDLDNGEAMLSPLVMCGPQGLVFLRAVTLRLPHCANAVPSLGLTLKATDTEAHLSTDWDNIHLPATTTLNTVAVKVDHF